MRLSNSWSGTRRAVTKYTLPLAIGLLGLLATACQTPTPSVPTVIPSATASVEASPSATSPFSATPPPTLRVLVSATPGFTPISTQVSVQPSPTQGPKCYTVKAGETLVDLIYRAGYGEPYTVLDAVKALNGLDSNNIREGQQLCIPQRTATPTAVGYEATVFAGQTLFPESAGPVVTVAYTVKKGDDLLTILINSGVSLRMLCSLNQPVDLLNCAGCNLDSPDKPGCRPLLREGQQLYIPGPTPTPTITPTLTRSETPTPTPGHSALTLLSPTLGKVVSGPADLFWMPNGILEPDEYYLVRWSDLTTGATSEARVRVPTYQLPAELQPTDGTTHGINWRVWIARDANGTDLLISPDSVIYSFQWASR